MSGRQRVLVTGASGFIGSALCRRLAAASAGVHGTTRPPAETRDVDGAGSDRRAIARGSRRRPGGGVPDGVTVVEADLSRREDCRAVIEHVRPDVVYHLASLVTGARDLAIVPDTFDANLASSVYLMEAAETAGVSRLVLAGSLEEPGADEVPCSPYAASKAAASVYARLFAAAGRLDVRSARLAMIYGPHVPDRTKLVPHVVDALLDGRVPEVTSGTRLADWTHVDDTVDALLALGTRERVDVPEPGFGVSIGTGRARSVRDVVETLVALAGSRAAPSFGARPDRAREPCVIADVDAAERAIGWRARVNLRAGLAATWRAELLAREAADAAPDDAGSNVRSDDDGLHAQRDPVALPDRQDDLVDERE